MAGEEDGEDERCEGGGRLMKVSSDKVVKGLLMVVHI